MITFVLTQLNTHKKIEIMRNNAVQFIENFGAVEDWKDMTMGDFIKSDISDLIIQLMKPELDLRESRQMWLKSISILSFF